MLLDKHMKLNPNFVNLFSEITSNAAIASFSYIGSGNKNKDYNELQQGILIPHMP